MQAGACLFFTAEFWLGEHYRVVMASVAGFSHQRFREYVSRVRPKAPLLEISCRTGEGLEHWMEWLFETVPAKTPEPEEKS